MVTPPQQFCVRWNSYQSNLQNAFPKLLNSEHFVDVTLACENEMLKCHKIVLSACSTYFEKLLLDNPCQHPIIFMKDMKFQEMQSLVDFMYKGEVNVTQDDLPSLLKSAEALQIRGLCGHEQLLSQHQLGALKPQSKPVANHSMDAKNPDMAKPAELNVKKEDKPEGSESGNNPSSSECDSNDGVQSKGKLQMTANNHLRKFFPEQEMKEELGDNDSYYEGESDLMDTEFLEEDVAINTNDLNKTPEFAIANVSCQYDGSPGGSLDRMAKEEEEDKLPDQDAAKEFYAKYEPKEILGRGISSTVRRCIEKETGKEYAAKIIDLSNDGGEISAKEATKQEVAILRHVAGHSYIIELQDVFESPTFIFLVFELCKNGELFDYLTSVVTLSEKKTRYIMKQVLEGVAHIHSRGVVHRDLKPENILLDDNLNVKITDFGFAKKLQPGEVVYELCGTPGYLAPETLKCNMMEDAPGYSYEVDIWACGVIMYTLLVGCPPFWHRKQMIMLRNIMEGKYSFSSPEWADISEPPKDLIRKLLVVDPKQRISITEALQHPFFQTMKLQQRKFHAREKFQWAILVVRAVVRLQRLKYTPEPLSLDTARTDPYRIKLLRKIVDGCAFRVYGHWVKKGEGQNRAALFENAPKTELKHIYVTNLSR